MSDQAEVDDFLMLCEELCVIGTRRRGLLWHSLCRARAIGAQQVLVSLRGLITSGHQKELRPLRVHEVLMAVKLHQEPVRRDMARWHDLPEKYLQAEPSDLPQSPVDRLLNAQAIIRQLSADVEEDANDGTGETPAIPDRDESTAPETGGAEAGECGGRDDVG